MPHDVLDFSGLSASDIGLEPGTNYLAGEMPTDFKRRPEFRRGVSPIFFDLETKPLPLDQLLSICGEFPPIVPYQAPPPFDPDSVKLGNTKAVDKVAAKIEEARAKYEADAKYARENHELIYAEKKAEYETNLLKDAALHPHMSKPLAIGYLRNEFERELVIHATKEVELIKAFWEQFQIASDNRLKMVGHNILDFDLPYIMRRSFILHVRVPIGVMDKNRKYFSDTFADTLEYWLCGQRRGAVKASLDHIDRCLGGSGKGELDGSMFHRLWDEDRNQAVNYLVNDLEIVERVWGRVGQ